jgi:hypothetical protein
MAWPLPARSFVTSTASPIFQPRVFAAGDDTPILSARAFAALDHVPALWAHCSSRRRRDRYPAGGTHQGPRSWTRPCRRGRMRPSTAGNTLPAAIRGGLDGRQHLARGVPRRPRRQAAPLPASSRRALDDRDDPVDGVLRGPRWQQVRQRRSSSSKARVAGMPLPGCNPARAARPRDQLTT